MNRLSTCVFNCVGENINKQTTNPRFVFRLLYNMLACTSVVKIAYFTYFIIERRTSHHHKNTVKNSTYNNARSGMFVDGMWFAVPRYLPVRGPPFSMHLLRSLLSAVTQGASVS